MTLDELYSNKIINTETFIICRNEGIESSSEIRKFFMNNRSLKNLQNLDKDSIAKLLEICISPRFNSQFMINESPENYDLAKNTKEIDELLESGKICQRIYNICKSNNLHSIGSIINYYTINKTFKLLRNCGIKSNNELMQVCSSELEQNSLYPSEAYLLVNKLSEGKKLILTNFLKAEINKLSVRTKKVIFKELKNLISISNFTLIFLPYRKELQFDFFESKNIIYNEISILLLNVEKLIKGISNQQDESVLNDLNDKYLIKLLFPASEEKIESLTKIRIFQLIDILLSDCYIFNKNELLVLRKTMRIYLNETPINLRIIAEKLKLSYERVRQIRIGLLIDFKERFSFIKQLKAELFENHEILRRSNYIFVSDELGSKINSENGTKFTNEFITFIIGILFDKEFEIIGDYKDALIYKVFNHLTDKKQLSTSENGNIKFFIRKKLS